MSAIEVKVPDIGDFKDIPVIEVFVKPGDTVAAEDSLVTLESDKATMDVPSPAAGIVKEVKVKVGDKVSEGSLIVVLESGAGGRRRRRSPPPAPPPRPRRRTRGEARRRCGSRREAAAAAAPIPGAATYTGKADIECEMLVLGAGPGGYSAAFRAADLGMKTVLVERYATLGGVCLNVGCIPSKALLHIAAVMDETKALAEHGIAFGAPKVDLDELRGWKNKVVGKLTGGLAGMAKARKVEVVRGVGKFLDPHHVEVELTEGTGAGEDRREEGRALREGDHRRRLAVGAAAVRPRRSAHLRLDRRARARVGARSGCSSIGGGIIGLEMGTVYSSLGTRLDVVEMLDGLMPGADRDLVRVWEKMNKPRFDRIMLKTKTTAVEAKQDAL